MAHDGNTGLDDGANLVEYAGTAFHLHRLGTAFLDEPSGVLNRIRFRDVVGHERHVSHQKRSVHTATDAASMENHFVHGHGQGIFIAHGHHARRVAH